jgi:hypothetical protein
MVRVGRSCSRRAQPRESPAGRCSDLSKLRQERGFSTTRSRGPAGKLMSKCARCGSEFHGSRCPACGESPVAAARAVNKELQKYSYPLLAGLVGMLAATHYYPPLDSDSLLIAGLCVLFLPIVMHVVISARKRLSSDSGRLRTAYICSGGFLILLAAFMLLNGALDGSPVRKVRTSIIRKSIARGRSSTTRTLVVSSWRPGRSQEKLEVNSRTYQSVLVGEPIEVEVHDGFFRLPWYGRIVPRPRDDQAVTWGATPTACGRCVSAAGRSLFFLCSIAAPMKAAKRGCGSSGLDLNSGWNWQPRNHG